MATTALSTKVVDYPALSPNSRQMQVIAANLEGEQMSETDLVRVKTPLGGATQWSIDVDGNVETTDEIVGLLVGIGKKGLLWPAEDPSESRPVVVSNDLMVGYRVSDDLGTIDPDALERYRIGDRKYDWAALANSSEFGYGSSRSGSGKRCKEARVLAILRQGETWPILVTVGPGSLRNIIPFLKRLPCFPHEAVVGLKLVRSKGKGGQPYSQIVPRLVGQISEEQGEVARRTYADPIRAMFTAPPIGGGAVEIEDEE
jgi:hypothetical protein